MQTQRVTHRLRPLLALALGLALTAVLAAGYGYYRHLEAHLRSSAEGQLSSIVQLKLDQVTQWRQERLSDAEFLFRDPSVRRWNEDILTGRDQTGARGRLTDLAEGFRQRHAYEAMVVVDREWRLVAAFPGDVRGGDALLQAAQPPGPGPTVPLLTDFFLLKSDPAGNPQPAIALVIPIVASTPGASPDPLGYLVVWVNPTRQLYPLLQTWPVPSPSAETMLLRPAGDGALVLNDLRHQSGLALISRAPLAQTNAVTARALSVQSGIVRGADYRGRGVVGAVRPVPDTVWRILAKVDRAELEEPPREQVLLLGLALLGLLSAMGLGAALLWRSFAARARRRVEQVRAETERRYHDLFNLDPDALLFIDTLSLAVLDANEAAARLYGYAREDLLKLKVQELSAEPDETERAVRAGAQHVFLRRHKRKDGSIVPVEIRSATADWDGRRMLFAAVRDISDRLAVEEALRQSESNYRLLFQANPHPMWVYDLATLEFLAVNPAAIQHYGYSRDEFLSMRISDIRPREDVPALLANVARVREGLDRAGVWRHRRKDGTIIDVEITSHALTFAGRRAEIVLANDVTERARLQRRLEENEQRLRLALEAVNDGVWDWHVPSGQVFFSPRYYTMLGYEPAGFPATYEEWRARVHPDDLGAAEAAIRRVWSTPGAEYASEFRMLMLGGRWLWVLSRGKVVERNGAGEVVRMIGIHTDITARKEAEERLRRSQARLAEAQRIAHLGSWEVELLYPAEWTRNPLWWSEEVYRIFGRAPGQPEASLAAFLEAVHPDDRAGLLAASRKAIAAGNAYQFEHRILRPDGALRIVLEQAEIVRDPDGRAQRLVGTVQDITDTRLAESEFRQLATAVQQAAEDILITDPEGHIRYVNPAFERLTGYSRAEVMGRNPSLLKSGKQGPAFYHDMWARLRAGQVWIGRLVNRRKDGQLIEEEGTIAPIHDPSGVLLGYVSVKHDVTERASLERQLRQAQKMEAVGQLAGGVAHDFNNLLQVIVGNLDLARDRLEPAHPVLEALGEIHRAAARAADLVRQLLAFSRVEVMRPTPVQLGGLVASLMKMIRRLIGEHIECSVQSEPGLPVVMADPGQIEQVIFNLCVNARDAMPRGGRLTLQTRLLTLDEVACRHQPGARPGRFVVLVVSDNGQGMSPEVREHIFEPFFTTKEVGKGTGLGLATVYGIVRQHQGFITVESEPGAGATFRIHLPASAAVQTAAAPAPTVAPALPGGRETILVAEDEPMVRALTIRILERAGYRVVAAADGQEALRLFHLEPEAFDLALLDVVMPRAGGREAAQAIRILRPRLPILFATGYTREGDAAPVDPTPQSDVLRKPFSSRELLERVRGALDSPPGAD